MMDLHWPAAAINLASPASFSRACPEDEPALAALMGLSGQEALRPRFEGGRRCYLARVEGALAAYGWVSFEQEAVPEMDLRIRLQPGEAYVWDCATSPALRRRGLYTALLVEIANRLRDQGLCRLWIGADLTNQPSQAGIAKAGFQPIADVSVQLGRTFRRIEILPRPNASPHQLNEMRRVFLGPRHSGNRWLLPPVAP
jgi:GNAT superfamily N-acetyltransferase